MRTALVLAVLTATSIPSFAETVPLATKIEAVTVYPAGAEVVRVGRAKLVGGVHALVLSDLPPEAISGSVRVEGKSAGALEIGAVDTRRMFVPQHGEAAAETERKRIEKEIETLTDRRQLSQDMITAADTQRALVTNLASLPNRPPPTSSGGVTPTENWSEVLALMATSLKDIAQARIAAETATRDIDRQINDLRGKLASLAPTSEERTEVKVAVKAGGDLEADITVRYQVPNASWSPSYDARLTTGTKAKAPSLALLRRATITQRTGEAWDNIALQLSTTRPTAGTSAPELHPIAVDFEIERPEPVAAAPPAGGVGRRYMADRVAPEPESDAVRIQGEVTRKRAMPAKVAATRSMANVVIAPFQAIYAVPGLTTVANTGEAKGVALATDTFEPTLLARAVPKRDAKAFLYAKFDTPRGSPLLPGTVALFRDGTFVGNGRLPLLAGGEKHELGFGADDLVRIRHTVAEEKRGETGLISSSRTDERNYRMSVKNMHERAVDVTLLDQIPVSRNEEIKVELVGRQPPTKRDVDDKRGVMAWEQKVEADEEKVIEFGYRVIWPAAKAITYSGG
ncbi:MAG: mucoidy inhibitor MuiA family protein [Hyphomicrobiaceae bacterium]|nr:mucoidy inhibitor MuiA family protein [Hyphomicrobiaceae bacterium]